MRAPTSEIYTMLFSMSILSLQMVEGRITPKCDPEDNKYYHSQALTCFQCEECLNGDEVIPMEKWKLRNWNPQTGPTECRPCQKCRPDTFSKGRSYECTACRNCTLHGQYETVQCTHLKDTVCDGVLPPAESPKPMNTNGRTNAESKGDGNGNSLSFIIIAGMICLTIAIIVPVMTIYLRNGKRFNCMDKVRATDNKAREDLQNSPNQSLKEMNSSSDHTVIEMPPCKDEEIAPLLESTNSLASDSDALISTISQCVLLRESQESLCVDGSDNPDHCNRSQEVSIFPVQETQESCSLNSFDLKSETFHESLESLSIQDFPQVDSSNQEESPASESDEDSNPRESFARKIQYERQWSYPLDGQRKRDRDYIGHTALAPIPYSVKESNSDVTVISKEAKNGREELTERELWQASRYLVPKKLYISIVRELGLPEIDIQTVDIDYKGESVKEKAYQTLLQLRRKIGCITRDTFKYAITKYDQEAWNNIEQSCH